MAGGHGAAPGLRHDRGAAGDRVGLLVVVDVHAAASGAVMGGAVGAKPLHFGAQVAEDIRHLAVAQFPHGFGQRGYLVAQGLVGHGASWACGLAGIMDERGPVAETAQQPGGARLGGWMASRPVAGSNPVRPPLEVVPPSADRPPGTARDSENEARDEQDDAEDDQASLLATDCWYRRATRPEAASPRWSRCPAA